MSHTRGNNGAVPCPYNQIKVSTVLKDVPMRNSMRRLASLTNGVQHGGQLSLLSGAPLNPLSSGAPLGISLGGLESNPAQQFDADGFSALRKRRENT